MINTLFIDSKETTLYQIVLFFLRLFKLFLSTITEICENIVRSQTFERFCFLIIFLNTLILILDDPKSSTDYGNQLDEYFLMFYLFEMVLKISGLGFVFHRNAYLRSGWNVLDFFIIITGLLNFMYNNDNNFSVLRLFRVLRPLKTISSMKSLKKIIQSLLNASPLILNELFIVLFWLVIYAIAGVQLLSGALKRRCFVSNTGLMLLQNGDPSYNGILCGSDSCPKISDDFDVICGRIIENPCYNIVNFDTFFWSLLTLLQVITLENWSQNMYYTVRVFGYPMVLFFISLIFIGSYILMNMLVSIIMRAYQQVDKDVSTKDSETEKNLIKERINVQELQTLHLKDPENYDKISNLINSQDLNSPNIVDKLKPKSRLNKVLQKIIDFFPNILKRILKRFFKSNGEKKKENMVNMIKEKRKSRLVNHIQSLFERKESEVIHERPQINVKRSSTLFAKEDQSLIATPSLSFYANKLFSKKNSCDNALSTQIIEKTKKNSLPSLVKQLPNMKIDLSPLIIKKNQNFSKIPDLLEKEKKEKSSNFRVGNLQNPLLVKKNNINITFTKQRTPLTNNNQDGRDHNHILPSSLKSPSKRVPKIKKNLVFVDAIGQKNNEKSMKISKLLSKKLGFKLMVDHSIEYAGSSMLDILEESKNLKAKTNEEEKWKLIIKKRLKTAYKLYLIKENSGNFINFFNLPLKKYNDRVTNLKKKNYNDSKKSIVKYPKLIKREENSPGSPSKSPRRRTKNKEKSVFLNSYEKFKEELRRTTRKEIIKKKTFSEKKEKEFTNEDEFVLIRVYFSIMSYLFFYSKTIIIKE